MHVRMRLPPAPPPPHLHRRHPMLCIPLQRTRHCSWGCHSHRSFSIIPSSVSAASSPSSKASISHKQPCTSDLHTPPLSHISFPQHRAISSWAYLPGFIALFPSAWPGLPLQQSPSPVLFTAIRSLKHRSGKSRQAVSSSCESVCWLGSWSSTVPLENDPVDEDRGDGPWGAAGETENSHSKHRWVTTTHSTPTTVPCYCVFDCRGLCMFVCNMDISEILICMQPQQETILYLLLS